MNESPTKSLASVGRCSQLAGCMPARFMTAAASLGVRPALKIDERSYFDEMDAERVLARLSQGKHTTEQGRQKHDR